MQYRFLLIPEYRYSLPTLTAMVQDVTENPNWNKCLDVNGASLARCIYNCGDNGDCEAACVDEFKIRTDDCPCEVCTLFSYS